MQTIVVVDDDDALRLALSIRLRAAGFEVLSSDHPEKAIQLVLRHKPALLVLDIEMPGYTGLEFHECLLLSNRGRSIPILYLTGRDSLSYRLRASTQGASGFMTKPYCAEDLIHTIRQLCRAQDHTQSVPD